MKGNKMSGLRKMADGGRPTVTQITNNRTRNIDAAVDAASGGRPANAAPVEAGPSTVLKPGQILSDADDPTIRNPVQKRPGALRRLLGFADGGKVSKKC